MNINKLITVLETANFTPKLVSSGTELTIACPVCWDEKQRLYISTSSGLWYCFHCNAKGNVISLLTDLCDLGAAEAFTTAASIRGKEQQDLPIIERDYTAPIGALQEVELPKDFFDLDHLVFKGTTRSTGLVYLDKRGIDEKLAKEYGVGYCMLGPYAFRIIVPVYTEGLLKTFVARSWLEHTTKKVLMPPGSQASSALFNYDNLVPMRGGGTVIIVEGVFDALRIIPTVPYVMATLGAHITTEQRILLKRKGYNNVILLRDGDSAGLEASIKEARLLRTAMMNVRIAKLPDGKDPNSATLEEVYVALNNAKLIEKDYGLESLREVLNG